MERHGPMRDSGIISEDVSAELGMEVASPGPAAAQEFREAIEKRDAEAFKQLINVTYPTVIWGEVFDQFSEKDKEWVRNVLFR